MTKITSGPSASTATEGSAIAPSDAPPGYVYDGGWRALAPDGQRTHPYTCLEAAARALAAAAFEDPHAPPVGWYPLPQRATVDTCKSCGQRIVWTKTEIGRAMPLSLALVRLYGDRKHAQSHFADCDHSRQWSTAKRGGPPPRQPTTTNRPAGRIARPAAFEDDA